MFLSLGKQFGKITKLTKNSAEVLSHPEKDLLNQPITNIIPSSIARVHDKFLLNICRTGTFRNQDMLLFVTDKNQYLIPLNKIFKLDILNEDIGISAFVYEASSTDGFILLRDDFQIDSMTKNIYLESFRQSHSLSVQEVYSYDMERIIPYIIIQQEALRHSGLSGSDQEIQTFMIVPRREEAQKQFEHTNELSNSFSQGKSVRSLRSNVASQRSDGQSNQNSNNNDGDIELVAILPKQRKQQIVKKLNKIFSKVYEDEEFGAKYAVFAITFRMIRVDCFGGFSYHYLQVSETKEIQSRTNIQSQIE